jgi:quercetin dioxygenase-like cupin family protein
LIDVGLAGAGLMQLWVFGILATLKVSGNETGGAFAMHEDLVAPGSRGPYPHYHTREDEYWHMAEGELTWIIDGKEMSAPTGSSLHLRRGVLHGFENRSGQFARLLVMYTPGKFQEWFVKVGKPTEGASFPGPAPTPEDFGLAFHWMEVYGLGFTPPPKQGDAQQEEL